PPPMTPPPTMPTVLMGLDPGCGILICPQFQQKFRSTRHPLPMSPRRKPGSIDAGLWNIGPGFRRGDSRRFGSEDILLIPRPEAELLARFGRCEGTAAEQLDDVDRLLDELTV